MCWNCYVGIAIVDKNSSMALCRSDLLWLFYGIRSCVYVNHKSYIQQNLIKVQKILDYTYIYAKVPKEKYQRVTGYTRASLLTGRFLAGVLAQILVSFSLMNVRELNYISFGSKYAVDNKESIL